jgi:hypothetical protein
MIAKFAAGISIAACLGGAAYAADLGGLEWGKFRVAMESPSKPKDVATTASEKELTLSMTLEKLIANADGGKTEDSASMEGEFVVGQPRTLRLNSMKVELVGHIVKTEGTSAQLTVKIGGMEKSFEWKPADVKSGQFTEVMTVTIPNGELPVPFPVSALATVNRTKEQGAVLLTLDQIKVTIGPSRVAEVSWGMFTPTNNIVASQYGKSAAIEDRSGLKIQ